MFSFSFFLIVTCKSELQVELREALTNIEREKIL